MNDSLFLIKWFFLLGLPGLLVLIYRHIKTEGYVTIGHLFVLCALLFFAPFTTIYILVDWGIAVTNFIKINCPDIRNVVLWRSKSNRAKQVLFSDEND